jgi:hypothetical protein
MSQRRFLTIAGTLVMLFSCPRDGSAGIIEIIGEMSGPWMLGGGAECRVKIDGTGVYQCDIFKVLIGDKQFRKPRVWVSFEGGPYVSLPPDASGQNYEGGKIWMVAFDPMLHIQTTNPESEVVVSHGVLGASAQRFFGEGFDAFTNLALKLRPIAVEFPIGWGRRIEAAYNLRLYPSGFTSALFGKTPVVPESDRPETVQSLNVSFRF